MLGRSPESNRPAPAWQTPRFEEDVIIALAHQHSDTAVDILGATILGDLRGVQPVKTPGTPPQIYSRASRNQTTAIATLLGHTGNPRAVRWLVAADDLIAGRTRPGRALPPP